MKLLVVFLLLLLTGCPAQQEPMVVAMPAPVPVFEPQKTITLPAPAAGERVVERDYNAEAKFIAAQMQNASVVFTVPKELNIKEVGAATLTVDPTKLAAHITEAETAETHVKKQDIRITRTAIATLTITPNDGLIVRETQSPKQVVRVDGPTTWQWELAPVTEGSYKMNVTLEAVVQVAGEFAPMKQMQFNDSVTINITKRQVIERWIHNHIDPILNWIWTVLLVPAFLFLKKKYFNKHK